MQLTTQVMARNTKRQVVVLSSDPKGSEYVEWQAADDPSGNDMQIVPESIAQSVPFIRLVQRGIIVVENAEDNPALLEAIERQRVAFENRTQRSAASAQASIDKTANNDLISLPCVGPDSRGIGTCGEPVPVREVTKSDRPPLCNQHAALAPQYVPFEEQVGTENQKVWRKVSVTSPERQQS